MDISERFPTRSDFVAYLNSDFPGWERGVRWTTGGMSGGSCWNDDGPTYSVESEPEEELTWLDELFTEIIPDLTFLEYRVLMKTPITKTTTGEDREYYGNYTSYARKTLDADALYDGLLDIEEKRAR